MADTFNTSLQQNVMTMLAYDDVNGKIIANTVDPALFEGDYRIIAERAVGFWRKFKEAPKDHLADELADILEDPNNRKAKTFTRILLNMREISDSINTAYVMEQVRKFTRMQLLKDAIIKSAEQLNKDDEIAIEQVEQIWNGILRSGDKMQFDPGITLWEMDRVIAYMEGRVMEFPTGIQPLDALGIGPARESVLILLGAAGKGKTWGLIHLGRRAVEARKRVMHFSLEMSEEQTALRYYMSMFGIPKRKAEQEVTVLDIEYDDKDRPFKLNGFERVVDKPEFALDSPDLRLELEQHMKHYSRRYEKNLRIKRFAPRSVTIADLEGYLDNLEITEGFIPDMIILDYIGIIKTDQRDHRISLGRQFEEFRGLNVRRKTAGVTAHQINRTGAHAQLVSSTHVAEDWSIVATADDIWTLAVTDAESQFGLGRLYVSKARNDKDRWGMVLTQNYDTGQFATNAFRLPKAYFDMFKDFSGEDAEGEEDDGDEKPRKRRKERDSEEDDEPDQDKGPLRRRSRERR